MPKVLQVGMRGQDSDSVGLALKPLVLTAVSHHFYGPVLLFPKSGNLILSIDPLPGESDPQVWDMLKMLLPVRGTVGLGRGQCWPCNGTAC